MPTTVKKRSLLLAGHKTSVSLEDDFWAALREIARDNGISAGELAARIETSRNGNNLSSAIRLFILDHYRTRAQARLEAMRTAA